MNRGFSPQKNGREYSKRWKECVKEDKLKKEQVYETMRRAVVGHKNRAVPTTDVLDRWDRAIEENILCVIIAVYVLSTLMVNH